VIPERSAAEAARQIADALAGAGYSYAIGPSKERIWTMPMFGAG
jgi:hypothetical protein